MPTLDLQVAASTDDVFVRWLGSYWALSATADYFMVGSYNTGSYQKNGGGMRFLDVAIPQGAIIDTAYLQIYCRTNDSNVVVNTRIIGEDTDDAATFSTIANYQARRGVVVGGANDDNITTAFVDWDNIPAWTVGITYDSPEIKTIIQEIINRPGWATGNALVIFWDDHAGRSTQAAKIVRRGRSYDYTGNIYGPKLHIEYTSGPPAKTTQYLVGHDCPEFPHEMDLESGKLPCPPPYS